MLTAAFTGAAAAFTAAVAAFVTPAGPIGDDGDGLSAELPSPKPLPELSRLARPPPLAADHEAGCVFRSSANRAASISSAVSTSSSLDTSHRNAFAMPLPNGLCANSLNGSPPPPPSPSAPPLPNSAASPRGASSSSSPPEKRDAEGAAAE